MFNPLFISYYSFLNFLQTLKSLDLSGNLIGDVGAQYLADALRDNKVNTVFSSSAINYIDELTDHRAAVSGKYV